LAALPWLISWLVLDLLWRKEGVGLKPAWYVGLIALQLT
jgi:hypothetical protein